MKEFSAATRKLNVFRLEDETYDLAIIGGGITGAGVARDAVSRGMKVALIEERDFAFGTSSRSSKLIHGGIRYLENKEFKLVFEALAERRLLFEIAPHLVHPLRFVLPIFEGDRVQPWLMGVGMWLYDALALFEVPEMHQYLNRNQSGQRVAHLNMDGLKGSFIYSDAYMDDDRLVLETLRSANDLGAVCANYVKATGAEFDGEKVKAIVCTDQKTNKTFKLRARHVVSTVGPWTDVLAQNLFKSWKKILRPSKGIHLILEKKRLPVQDAVVMSTRTDKRIVFVIPRHEMVIVGTTDTDFSGDPADVHTDSADVKYILELMARYFPTAKITKEDFISSYAGVRPLVADDATTESGTSREHIIIPDPRNITFVAGGKYTTYRHMAEQTVETALKNFSLEERVKFGRNNTKTYLNPAASASNLERANRMIQRWSEETTFSESEIGFLVDRHGMETETWLHYASKNQIQNIWELEAAFAIQQTMCLHLDDFYLRRVPLFLMRRDHGLSEGETLAQYFAQSLGWNESEKAKNLELVTRHIKHELSWK